MHQSSQIWFLLAKSVCSSQDKGSEINFACVQDMTLQQTGQSTNKLRNKFHFEIQNSHQTTNRLTFITFWWNESLPILCKHETSPVSSLRMPYNRGEHFSFCIITWPLGWKLPELDKIIADLPAIEYRGTKISGS